MTEVPRTADAIASHRHELNQRLRAAFVAGAEARAIKERGRGLTDAELRRVLLRYPGDLAER